MSTATATAVRPIGAPPRVRFPLGEAALVIAYLAVCLVAAAVGLEWITRPTERIPVRELAAPLWTIAVGILCSTSCAILGCYLVLRRMSLLGDAISHAVLPGIVVAVLLTGKLTGWPIFVGAMVVGVLTSFLAQGVTRLGRVSEDASLGIVFTSLFALGVVLIQAFARHADLDVECVLFGQIDTAGLTDNFHGWQISRPILTLLPAIVLTVAFVALFWKELKLVSFDPAHAAAMGIRVAVIHYSLMAMVSGVTVASFESVGSILVVAMLVVPGAAAALMSDRLIGMMAWAVVIAIVSAVLGYVLAVPLGTSVAGMMAVVAGVQFALAVFLSPKHGLASRWLRNLSLAVRIASEDVIARLYRAEEASGGRQQASGGRQPPEMQGFGVQGSGESASGGRQPPESLGVRDQRSEVGGQSTIVRWLARLRLARRCWTTTDRVGQPRLTDTGRTAARNLVRAHRLWETYLDTHFDLPRDHLHDAAERMEHFLDPALQAELDSELAGVATDPHGKAIPPAGEPASSKQTSG